MPQRDSLGAGGLRRRHRLDCRRRGRQRLCGTCAINDVQTLTILYTGGIRGDLDLLPRLHTFLRGIRRQPALLLDLGESCAPDVWPCGVTEGRSTLLALDAMGYHAANTQGLLAPESRQKLAEQVTLALVDDAHPFVHENTVLVETGFAAAPPEGAPYALTVRLAPAPSSALDGRSLSLAAVQARQIGEVRLDMRDQPPALLSHAVLSLPPDTLPDATLSGVVDFIRGEARYYESQRRK